MSQLKIDVEIMHPPALIWRALTEAKSLNEWFQPVAGWPESGARPGSQGRVLPTDDLRGFGPFDLDLIEADPHSRLVARWRGDDFTSDMIWEIRPIPGGGSRLLMRQTGFLGTREAERRETLSLAHQVMLDRLQAAIGRLSLGIGEGGFLRSEAPEPEPERPGLRAHHRVRIIAVACVVIAAALCGSAGAMWMNRATPQAGLAPPGESYGDPGLGTGMQPVASENGASSAAVERTPEKSGPSVVAPPAPPPASGKPLVASYRIRALPVGLLGFDTEVTVRNPGTAEKNGWTVTLTMPDSTAVQNQSAAVVNVRQKGDVVTVTPVTAALPAGGSLSFTIRFPALLALGPSIKACTIDGHACTAA